jgi:magnesium-transporting ATPase (P-type)
MRRGPPLLLTLITTGTFLLPFGFLGMASLAMPRSPWLASIGGALSLIGTMTTVAFTALSDMTYDMAQLGSSPQFIALWDRFNSDALMTAFLVLFILGFVGGPTLLGIALGRARVIPLWAASAIVISRLILIIAFPAHLNSSYFEPATYGLLFLVCIPAALAMLKFREKEEGN